jgi:hypothetical protein
MKSFSTLHEASLSDSAMTFLIYKFAILIKKPYNEWDAFDEGIIDKDGEIIKEPSTTSEKKSFGKMEKFILKIKKILLKYIKSPKLLTILVYAYILKAESGPNIAILELEEELNIEERNDLVEFVKGYYNLNKSEF